MARTILTQLLWGYWHLNRPFLRRFVPTLLGEGNGLLRPDPDAVIDGVEEFIREAPDHVRKQLLIAQFILPVSAPRKLPEPPFQRTLVRFWSIFESQISRILFLFRTRRSRRHHVERVFVALAEQARLYEDDFLKSITVLSNVKALFGGVFMEQDDTWKALGYDPCPSNGLKPPHGLDVEHPAATPRSELLRKNARRARDIAGPKSGRRTYCIIGSGAGGATAAYSIQQHDPDARIIILEGGPLVTNDRFQTKSLKATLGLFMNAGATLTADQNFTFRQGRCVGGSTTINNAVSIQPQGFWWERNIIERWEHLGARPVWSALEAAYRDIAELIDVHPLDEAVITDAARTFDRGFVSSFPDVTREVIPANLVGCVGCGRCNLGCQYEAKRSMLATLIPAVVERGGILAPDAKVERIVFEGNGTDRRVRHVSVVADGQVYEIEADRFVLAAGAYASSKLLWDSGFQGAVDGVRTVGRRFTCNFGSPVIGRFAEPQYGWRGQQIGYVYHIPDDRMVIETAFAPPAAIGLLAPQWGDAFLELAGAYSSIAVATPTVGSVAYGDIREKDDPLGERGYLIDYALDAEDWRRLSRAMNMSAVALFDVGAEEIYTTRFDARTITAGEYRRDPGALDRYFAGIGPSDYFKVESGHPQGGNVIHESPYYGVVDDTLKVHGVDNLWICDASVIPASITMNLQMTIMALARYASGYIVR